MNLDSCIFPCLEKHENHSLRYLLLGTSSNLLLRWVLECTYSFTKITETPSSPTLSRAVPWGHLRGCLPATVLSETLNKINSQLLHCAFFSG